MSDLWMTNFHLTRPRRQLVPVGSGAGWVDQLVTGVEVRLDAEKDGPHLCP